LSEQENIFVEGVVLSTTKFVPNQELARQVYEDVIRMINEQQLSFFERLILSSDTEFRKVGLTLETEQHRKALTEVVKQTYERTSYAVKGEIVSTGKLFDQVAILYIEKGRLGILLKEY